MLEWLICAAGVTTHAGAVALSPTSSDEAAEDFLEFLAEWNDADVAVLESEGEDGQHAEAASREGASARASESREARP